MPEPIDLTSMDNPRVKAVVRLREHKERRATGQFVAEGTREIERALKAGLALQGLFVCTEQMGVPDRAAALRAVPGLEATRARVFTVTPALFNKMAYCENPEGILGIFEQPRWSLAEFPSPRESGKPELWLVAVGTQKPGNLGAMARSAEAAGATGLLVADAVVDPFNPNALRSSTGAVLAFPVLGGSAEEVLAFLRARNVRVLAASPEATTPYTGVDLTGPVALVVGPEDSGFDERWRRAAADAEANPGAELIAVPMRGRIVDSLNASACAAVLLFEALRQRQASLAKVRPQTPPL